MDWHSYRCRVRHRGGFFDASGFAQRPRHPKFAGAVEISYSLIALAYLLQGHVRAKYRIGN
jgi:hypothetical protein